MENFKNFEKCLDEIVKKKIEQYDRNNEPNSVIELLIDSDVY